MQEWERKTNLNLATFEERIIECRCCLNRVFLAEFYVGKSETGKESVSGKVKEPSAYPFGWPVYLSQRIVTLLIDPQP